jgi:hypothetical protein
MADCYVVHVNVVKGRMGAGAFTSEDEAKSAAARAIRMCWEGNDKPPPDGAKDWHDEKITDDQIFGLHKDDQNPGIYVYMDTMPLNYGIDYRYNSDPLGDDEPDPSDRGRKSEP